MVSPQCQINFRDTLALKREIEDAQHQLRISTFNATCQRLIRWGLDHAKTLYPAKVIIQHVMALPTFEVMDSKLAAQTIREALKAFQEATLRGKNITKKKQTLASVLKKNQKRASVVDPQLINEVGATLLEWSEERIQEHVRLHREVKEWIWNPQKIRPIVWDVLSEKVEVAALKKKLDFMKTAYPDDSERVLDVVRAMTTHREKLRHDLGLE